MRLPAHRTKIIATIGPGSKKIEIIERMIRSGMSVARINFSHGKLDEHRETVEMVRRAAKRAGRRVAILGDLPGVKIRVGEIENGSAMLERGRNVVLTTSEVIGDSSLIPVKFEDFPKLVSPGDVVYLSDGFISLKVREVRGEDVVCKVISGGRLYSHKGINVPNSKIEVDAITERDMEILEFAVSEKLDMVGISFVGRREDVRKVRGFLEEREARMFVISKIERQIALRNFDSILAESDGIMVARGDLGVETPIEKLPVLQKKLIRKANVVGKPVITATQMLESMTFERMPTRAEVTDVANAIIDGTDAVMLSEEMAVGKYPVETVRMMAKIAATTEDYINSLWEERMTSWLLRKREAKAHGIKDAISRSVIAALNSIKIRYILTPTRTGETPRLIARFRPRQWILAFTEDEWVANTLTVSRGVYPFVLEERSEERIVEFVKSNRLARKGDNLLITEGIPTERTTGTNSMKIFTL